MANDLVV